MTEKIISTNNMNKHNNKNKRIHPLKLLSLKYLNNAKELGYNWIDLVRKDSGYKVNEVHINESSGDVHIAKKLLIRKLFKKSESQSQSESESESDSELDSESNLNIKTKNVYNISRDIEDGVRDIFLSIQKYYVDSRISDLVGEVNERPLCLDEYNDKIEKGIDDILLKMPFILTPKIHQLRNKLLKKYINRHEIKLTKTFWNNHQVNGPIVNWY